MGRFRLAKAGVEKTSPRAMHFSVTTSPRATSVASEDGTAFWERGTGQVVSEDEVKVLGNLGKRPRLGCETQKNPITISSTAPFHHVAIPCNSLHPPW